MVALSARSGFRCRLTRSAAILLPVVSMGKSLKLRKSPPPWRLDFDGFLAVGRVERRRILDSKAGFSAIWWNGNEFMDGGAFGKMVLGVVIELK